MAPLRELPAGLEDNPSSGQVTQLALRFGVGAGIACAVWFLFLQFTGNNPFGPKQLLGQFLVPLAAVGSQWVLRRLAAPGRPGAGRSLAVGGLTVLLAAAVAAGSVWGLAHGVDRSVLNRNQAEMAEIVRVQQEIRPKEKRNKQFEALELRQAAAITVRDLVVGTFTRVVLLGMLVALPAGLFLRK